MSAKKLIVAVLASALLSACGNSNYQAPLPGDGTYDSGVLPSDDYDAGGYDPGSTGGDYDDPASDGFDLTDGYTLKGKVIDKATNKPLAGAKISIGFSTQLTAEDGTFEFEGIMQTPVYMTVTKDGYKSVNQVNVAFSEDAPIASKEILLAASGSSSDSDDEDGNESDEPGFDMDAAYGEGKFKSVSAMAVEGDTVYVLGVVDGFLWFNRNSVVAFDLETGEEVASFNKTGVFSRIPKDVDSMKLEDGELYVSNGEEAYVFSPSGEFLKKTTGSRYAPVKEVKIDGSTFKLSGDEVIVDGDSYELPELGTGKSIGADSGDGLLVLDTTDKVVRRYSFSK